MDMPRTWTPTTTTTHQSPDSAHADEQLRQVDVCFVMDATGSMSSYINAARSELKSLVQRLSAHPMKPKMAFALVLYRDHPPQESTFVTQMTALNSDSSAVQRALDGASANGGGDGPEAVTDGLADAVNKTQWRKGAHRVIMLAGDAPPHGYGGSGDGWPQGCPCGNDPVSLVASGRDKGITTFCLGIGDDETMVGSFQRIAQAGGGVYVSLANAASLIEQILKLTMGEFSKVEIDRIVFAAYSPSSTVASIARATGLSDTVVQESLDRLRRKEMIRP
jgi:Mg-chelatase subunit ChlD